MTSLPVRVGGTKKATCWIRNQQSCHQIALEFPVIDNGDLAKLLYVNERGETPGFKSFAVDGLFAVSGGGTALKVALNEICQKVTGAISDGANIVILSDRHANAELAPIPSLLLTAAVHNHLVRVRARTRCGLVIESGDAREVHHMALLVGYGAAAVNPYLAIDSVRDLVRRGELGEVGERKAVANYVKAAGKGILKVMSKMGISTIASYTGAQESSRQSACQKSPRRSLFYRDRHQNRRCGTRGPGRRGSPSGITSRSIPTKVNWRIAEIEVGGEYQWRREGEYHLFNPKTVFKLQHATRAKRYEIFKEYTRLVDEQSERLATLRGLMRFRTR